ncbi:MAG: DUF1800 domain-containing protein [Cyanobacteria bacterium SZAS LIN-2]|nr:DUF1800 domain-containing protein [Cyanobacteria bacterium SZAS LIN-2]MBS2009714.1 DUF1800 domain-containing protein [Cyanobacteria bacterium SZAS TMP-1]
MKRDSNPGSKQMFIAAMTLGLVGGLSPSLNPLFMTPAQAQAGADSDRLVRPGDFGTPALAVTTAPAATGRRAHRRSASVADASAAGNPTARSMNSDQQIVHLLNRITFGARPGDVERVKQQGIRNYIAAQLNPESIPESPEVLSKVQNTHLLNVSSMQAIAEFRQFQKERKQLKQQELAANPDTNQGANQGGGKPGKQFKDQLGDSKKRMGQELMEVRLLRAIDSNRQLQEVMTDFWYNHFNISIDKGFDHVLVGAYEEQAIRPFALGKFRDLVGATCHHPAMLFYLDNWQNSKPGTTDRKGKESGINENYARELMELHTLGVDGGYTQKDVQELARVLTGLGITPDRRQIGEGLRRAGFQGGRGRQAEMQERFAQSLPGDGKWGFFNSNKHDFGEKVVLGQRIAGTGEQEIEQCLDMLCRHPSTAHHIAFQLAQYFVADTPPPALVDKLAAKFTASDGDIKAVMATLLDSPEFWDGRYKDDKFKSPFRYTVSIFRATGTEPRDFQPVIGFLRLQGQPLYGCLTPDGYKNTQSAWLNPDALINRINFATGVGSGKAKFLAGAPLDFNQIRDTVNGGMLSQHTESVISKAPPPLKLSLLMGSPEFMHY